MLCGCSRTSPEVVIETGLVLIVHGNENPFLACSCLHFCYLGHENWMWLILVEVI